MNFPLNPCKEWVGEKWSLVLTFWIIFNYKQAVPTHHLPCGSIDEHQRRNTSHLVLVPKLHLQKEKTHWLRWETGNQKIFKRNMTKRIRRTGNVCGEEREMMIHLRSFLHFQSYFAFLTIMQSILSHLYTVHVRLKNRLRNKQLSLNVFLSLWSIKRLRNVANWIKCYPLPRRAGEELAKGQNQTSTGLIQL